MTTGFDKNTDLPLIPPAITTLPIPAAIKIAEMDFTLNHVKVDLFEIKQTLKYIGEHVNAIENSQHQITQLSESLNHSIRRSDDRWNTFNAERRDSILRWEKWQDKVTAEATGVARILDEFKGSVRAFNWIFGIVLVVAMSVGGYYVNAAAVERKDNVETLKANHIVEDAFITKNSGKIRYIENYLISKDPRFNPPFTN